MGLDPYKRFFGLSGLLCASVQSSGYHGYGKILRSSSIKVEYTRLQFISVNILNHLWS